VLRLTLASFARSAVEASGSALSAASARSRASVGARRLYLRLRGAPRGRLLARGRREDLGGGSKAAGGGVSAVRSSGASAPRTVAAVLGCRLRAARVAMISAITAAGSLGAISFGGEESHVPGPYRRPPPPC